MSAVESIRTFRYRAIERANGATRNGEITGVDAYSARAALRRVGLDVLDLKPVGERQTPQWLAPLQRSWDARQRSSRRALRGDLLDAIATLLLAGLPLEQALGSLAASDARGAAERTMLRRVRERVRQGQALHEACAAHPDWFDRVDLALMEAGQHSGELPQVLRALSAAHERGAAIGHRIVMALTYPCLLLVAGLAVVVFISRSTLPQLLQVLRDGDRPTPLLTEWVVRFGDLLAVHGWWLVILLTITAIATARGLRRVGGHGLLARLVHGNPVARTRARARVAQLAGTLGRLQATGVPLAEALDVVASSSNDRMLAEFLSDAAERVRRGEDLSQAAEANPLLDPEFAQLLKIGEQSGELAQMLERIAARYERSAERGVDRLTALLEPAAIAILAVLIGIVVLAAALPLVALGDLV